MYHKSTQSKIWNTKKRKIVILPLKKGLLAPINYCGKWHMDDNIHVWLCVQIIFHCIQMISVHMREQKALYQPKTAYSESAS